MVLILTVTFNICNKVNTSNKLNLLDSVIFAIDLGR